MKTPPPTVGPLAMQVGGSHYKSNGVQHVQFCQRNSIPWCEACAIKYLMRHRLKNGKEDLLKARHYLELCIVEEYIQRDVNPTSMRPKLFAIPVDTLLKDNEVPAFEGRVITKILHHQVKLGEATLRDAMKNIDELVAAYDKQQKAVDGASLLE